MRNRVYKDLTASPGICEELFIDAGTTDKELTKSRRFDVPQNSRQMPGRLTLDFLNLDKWKSVSKLFPSSFYSLPQARSMTS